MDHRHPGRQEWSRPDRHRRRRRPVRRFGLRHGRDRGITTLKERSGGTVSAAADEEDQGGNTEYTLWPKAGRDATVPAVATTPLSRCALGLAVRDLREARGLTIEALANAAAMHPTYLSSIERGRANPSWDKLTGLARALDIELSALVRNAEAHGDQRHRSAS